MSVQILNPSNLPEEYGTGSQIEAVLLQVTDEPVNFHIERELPWLRSMNGNLAGSNGSSGTRNDPEKIMYYDFKLRGEK